jgi:hypothetical protein
MNAKKTTNPKIEDLLDRFADEQEVITKAYVPDGADALKPLRKVKRYAKGFAAELPEGSQLMGLILDQERPPTKSLAVVVLVESEQAMRLHALCNDAVDDYFGDHFEKGSDHEVAILYTYGVREDGSWTAFD